ncbi:hypothetical protein, partial [Mediterraneibacter sp.]
FNTNGKTRNLLARCIKTASRKISAGRKNLYFFNCLLDGEQFKVWCAASFLCKKLQPDFEKSGCWCKI